MKQLLIRSIIALVVIGGGLLAYQASDYYDCNGPKVREWLNDSTIRLEKVVSDQKSSKDIVALFLKPETLNTGASDPLVSIGKKIMSDDLRKYVVNAEDRYSAQQSQETPKCLSELQIKLVDTFYYNWKYYESALNSDFSSVNNYADKFNGSVDELIIEFDELSVKYNK